MQQKMKINSNFYIYSQKGSRMVRIVVGNPPPPPPPKKKQKKKQQPQNTHRVKTSFVYCWL